MRLAVRETQGNVKPKLHLYGSQTMSVTEFQNGVGDQIIQFFQYDWLKHF